MLHEPQVVEANLVGQLALRQCFLVQRIPVDFIVIRTLHFVQESKLHEYSPFRPYPRSQTAASIPYVSQGG